MAKENPIRFMAATATSSPHRQGFASGTEPEGTSVRFTGGDGFTATRYVRRPTIIDANDPGEQHVDSIRKASKFLTWLHDFETYLDRKMNFEPMGVERLPENMRFRPQVINVSETSIVDPLMRPLPPENGYLHISHPRSMSMHDPLTLTLPSICYVPQMMQSSGLPSHMR